MSGKASHKLNIFFNVSMPVIPLAVTILCLPLLSRQVGLERLGLITITWILLGYGSLLDGGLSRASTHELSRIGELHPLARRATIWTAFSVMGAVGLAGAVALYVAAHVYIGHIPKISDAVRGEYLATIPVVAVLFPIIFLGGVATGALESKSRFFTVNLINISTSSASQIGAVLVAYLVTRQLPVVMGVMVGFRALGVALMLWTMARSERLGRPLPVRKRRLKKLVKYAGWVSLTNAVSPVMDTVAPLYIAAQLGPGVSTLYSVPMSIIGRANILPSGVTRALFPTMAAGGRHGGLPMARKAFEALCGIMALVAAAGAAGSFVGLSVWMGSSFAVRASAACAILFAGLWANSVAYVGYSLLQAQGRPRVVALAHIIELPIYLGLLVGLTHAFGVVGAAMAWALRAVLDSIILTTRAGLMKTVWRSYVALGLFVACASVAALTLGPHPIGSAVLAALVTIPALGLSWVMLEGFRGGVRSTLAALVGARARRAGRG